MHLCHAVQVLLYHFIPGQLRVANVGSGSSGPVLPEVHSLIPLFSAKVVDFLGLLKFLKHKSIILFL